MKSLNFNAMIVIQISFQEIWTVAKQENLKTRWL